MNYASYQPISNPSVHCMATDTRAAKYMTPLYEEVLSIVLSSGKAGILASQIMHKATLTKHSSRIRLALDALEFLGKVKLYGSEAIRYRASKYDFASEKKAEEYKPS